MEQLTVQSPTMQACMMQPTEVNCVLYHANCSDGAAAMCIAKKFLDANCLNAPIYIPVQHGSALPKEAIGRNVLICDFSYKKAAFPDILSKVNKLLIIDHHELASKDLADLPPYMKIFNMERCGAVLTYQYFFGVDRPIPRWLLLVEDRDLWTKKLPYTEEFTAWFSTLEMTYETYDHHSSDMAIEKGIEQGRAYLALNKIYIEKACEYVSPVMYQIKGQYYFVIYINTSVLMSDIGNRVFDMYPLIDFSAPYLISNGATLFSLRSTPKHIDTAQLAAKFGGGGHYAASGCKIEWPTDHLPGVRFDCEYGRLQQIYYGQYNGCNVVYLWASTNKTVWGKYLLQVKYGRKDLKMSVQVCEAAKLPIGQFHNQLGKLHGTSTILIAAIVEYDPTKNITNFDLVLDELFYTVEMATEKDAIGILHVERSGCVMTLE